MIVYKSIPAQFENAILNEATKDAPAKIAARIVVDITRYSGGSREDALAQACALEPKLPRDILKQYIWQYWDNSLL